MRDKLFTLLELLGQIRQAQSEKELSFFFTNETHKLVGYDQAVYWTYSLNSVTLETASGNNIIEQDSPFSIDLKNLIKEQIKKYEDGKHTTITDLILMSGPDEGGLFLEHRALMTFKNTKGHIHAGLFFQKEKEFSEADQYLLKEIGKAYAYGLNYTRKHHGGAGVLFNAPTGIKKYIFIALLLSLFFPTRLTITAPGEVVSRNPTVITMPFDSVIDEILVQAGDPVREGDILAKLDKVSLQAQYDLAKQDLKTSRNKRARLRREALSNPDIATELNRLEADIKSREIEAEFAKKQLERTDITATANGIAIFSDISSLEGRPMRTGEEIITIANPKDTELLIRIPVDSMLPFSLESPVSFYPNTSPLSGYEVQIKTMGYQASPDIDGLLTYKIRGSFEDSTNDLRIGWAGTTKVQGNWSILGYSILRKPILALRRMSWI